MGSSSIDRFRWPSHVAATLVVGYQRYLSPLKGFSCAYRVLHGTESCSQYVKRTILERGLSDAWPDSRQRFRDCRSAYLRIMASRNDQDRSEYERLDGDRNKNNQNSRFCDSLNSNCGCLGDSFELFNLPCTSDIIDAIDCDLASCNLAACEVGACEVGACEVGSCDIGGCDGGGC